MDWKRFVAYSSVVLLLSGCGMDNKNAVDTIDDNVLYVQEEVLSHEMEQVVVDMTYHVNELVTLSEVEQQNDIEQGSIVVEGNVVLTNGTDRTIYYTPTFYAETEDGQRFENEAERLGMNDVTVPIILDAGEKSEFRIAFNLPSVTYESISELDVTVPVAFKEPDSDSSGDALGDTTIWTIQLKE